MIDLCNINFFITPRLKPGVFWWEAQTLPLRYAARFEVFEAAINIKVCSQPAQNSHSYLTLQTVLRFESTKLRDTLVCKGLIKFKQCRSYFYSTAVLSDIFVQLECFLSYCCVDLDSSVNHLSTILFRLRKYWGPFSFTSFVDFIYSWLFLLVITSTLAPRTLITLLWRQDLVRYLFMVQAEIILKGQLNWLKDNVLG